MRHGTTPPNSLYVHIPFCVSRCGYCAFNSTPISDRDPAPYVSALLREAETARAEYDISTPLATVFIGGGTPTILPAPEMERLFTGLARIFTLKTEVEITVEANPNRADLATFAILSDLGVNRLSIGVQSFNDATLKAIGRSHNAAEAAQAIKAARRAGFANLNLDLIRGLPGEDAVLWRHSVKTAIAGEPTHLSIYDLSIEPGSTFYRHREKLPPIDDDTLADMDAITAELTDKNGFDRYEISNYCRPGNECRHNINYWHNRPCLGIGAGAVSFLNGIRLTNVADADLYLKRIEDRRPPLAGFEILPTASRMRETVIMGLRMTRGPDLEKMKDEGFDPREYYGDTLIRLQKQGLVTLDDNGLRLTARGMRFANQVMAELV